MTKRKKQQSIRSRETERGELRHVRGGAMNGHLTLEANGTTVLFQDEPSK